MPDWDSWNDYHAFESTSGNGGSDGGGSTGGPGCTSGCLPWILAGVVILWVIGNVFA